MPKQLQPALRASYANGQASAACLPPDAIYQGNARELLPQIAANSIALSLWSPPYFVGKSYESGCSFAEWQELLREVIALHFPLIQPGGFLAINIADILCFRDDSMPHIQAEAVSRHRSSVSREDVLRCMREHPECSRFQLAKLLGCSEQTVDRRLHGNNIRGGKYQAQTRVKITGGLLEEWALAAGFSPMTGACG